MKLGLLLVLAVLAVVASLSESRIVSKCELRERLGEAIVLPTRLDHFKDSILAIISCEVERRSHLNSSLVKMYGKHSAPATAKPTTFVTAGISGKVTDAATMKPKTTKSTTTVPTTPANSSAGSSRSKRRAGLPSQDLYSEMSLEELLNEEENKFDEVEMQNDDERLNGEDSTEYDSLNMDGGLKNSQQNKKTLAWSLSYYGLFQLKDSHFCDSGFRWSRNVCHMSCSDFTDDDITDDVDCFTRSGYWRYVLRMASRSCRHDRKIYFNECK